MHNGSLANQNSAWPEESVCIVQSDDFGVTDHLNLNLIEREDLKGLQSWFIIIVFVVIIIIFGVIDIQVTISFYIIFLLSLQDVS